MYAYTVCGLLGGRYKSWKRRWFILNDNCLYYFQFTTVSSPLTHPVVTLRMMSMSLCLELIMSLRPFIIVVFLLAEASVGRLDYTCVQLCGSIVLLVKTCCIFVILTSERPVFRILCSTWPLQLLIIAYGTMEQTESCHVQLTY